MPRICPDGAYRRRILHAGFAAAQDDMLLLYPLLMWLACRWIAIFTIDSREQGRYHGQHYRREDAGLRADASSG